MLLISTVAGNTGWVNLFAHHPAYAGRLPNYTAAAGGRSFPSSAGFNTTEFFFTDDSGVYFLPTRDMTPVPNDGGVDLKAWTEAHRARIVKLADGRLNIPGAMPCMEGHNTWCANVPGSTLIWPVADVAQHVILLLLDLVQNGTGIYDDVNGRPIPGLGLGAGGLDRPRLAGAPWSGSDPSGGWARLYTRDGADACPDAWRDALPHDPDGCRGAQGVLVCHGRHAAAECLGQSGPDARFRAVPAFGPTGAGLSTLCVALATCLTLAGARIRVPRCWIR